MLSELLLASPPAPESIVTPSELRDSVKAALREREQIGDTLATGALKTITHLEIQANTLAWQSIGNHFPLAVVEAWLERVANGTLSPQDYAAKVRDLMVRR